MKHLVVSLNVSLTEVVSVNWNMKSLGSLTQLNHDAFYLQNDMHDLGEVGVVFAWF